MFKIQYNNNSHLVKCLWRTYWARQDDKYFTCCMLQNPHNNPVVQVLLLAQVYK